METQEPRENRTEKINEQIRHLTALRDNNLDEIPAQMTFGSTRHKVSRKWWQLFFDSIDYATI